MTLKTRTISSIGWSATAQIAQLLMQILISAILARLLTPSDFGFIAMILVFSNFVAVFSNFGLPSAIIQRKELPEKALSSVFWTSIGIGAVLTIAFAAAAPLIAAFYAEPRLTPLVVFMSMTFFIASFGLVPTALLAKTMRFKAIAVAGICALGIAGPLSIVLALSGYGVWSLAWNTVLLTTLTVAFTWASCRWRLHLALRLESVKALLGFGLNLTGNSFLAYFQRNLDNLLIGRFLGPTALGFYNLAYTLLLFPLANISETVGRVMFPALSVIQHDKQTVRHAYVAANRYIAVISFPLMTWLVVTAPQLIEVVYGPKWVGAIPLVQILALAGLEQSVGASVGWIFLSQGRTDVLFKLSIFTTIVVVLAFVVGLPWGVVGVAGAYTIASYALAYPVFTVTFRLVDLKLRYFVARLRSIIVATLIFGISGFLVRIALEALGVAHALTIVLIVTAASLSIYALLVFVLERELFIETVGLLRELRRGRSDVPYEPE